MTKGYPVYTQIGSWIYLELYGTNKDIPGIAQHQDYHLRGCTLEVFLEISENI